MAQHPGRNARRELRLGRRAERQELRLGRQAERQGLRLTRQTERDEVRTQRDEARGRFREVNRLLRQVERQTGSNRIADSGGARGGGGFSLRLLDRAEELADLGVRDQNFNPGSSFNFGALRRQILQRGVPRAALVGASRAAQRNTSEINKAVTSGRKRVRSAASALPRIPSGRGLAGDDQRSLLL